MLLLHRWDAEEHPTMNQQNAGPVGHGIVIYFRVDDLEATHARALELEADVLNEPSFNELSHQADFDLRDPDGYFLTVCD